MAILNEDNSISFEKKDIDAAWKNAPGLSNKDNKEFRMCYECKYHIEYKKFVGSLKDDITAWTIDLINAKTPLLEESNFIAVHVGCVELRIKKDISKRLDKIKKTEWKFDEEFYNS